MPSLALIAKDLTKRFGDRFALNGLDLEIEEGITYGLIGPNGAGKTTFIRTAAGLAKADSGRLEVLGKKMPDRSASKIIGYMTQKGALYADLTVFENLRFFGSLYGVNGKEGRSRIEEVLETVELSRRRNDIVGYLSGGMVQRVSLACALLHKPKLLFLDEPTAGVDPELRLHFWDYFEKLSAQGITIIVSTHHLDEAARCHKLGMLREGKIIADGSPAEIKKRVNAETIEEAFLKIARGGAGV